MSNHNERLQRFFEMLDRRSLRERVLVLLTLLVILIVGWNFLLLEPYVKRQKKIQAEFGQTRNEISQLKADAEMLRLKATADPDQENRRQIQQLQEVIGSYDRKLDERLVNLLSPQEMPVLLQKILKQQKGLKLISMENLLPEPLLPRAEGDASPPGLYRHGLRMEMEGNYLKLLTYLKALESMPQRMFWDELNVDTTQFPVTHIRFQIHTLSLTEDWIGA